VVWPFGPAKREPTPAKSTPQADPQAPQADPPLDPEAVTGPLVARVAALALPSPDATPLVEPLPLRARPRPPQPARKSPQPLPAAAPARAPVAVVERIVHEALAAWRFPGDPAQSSAAGAADRLYSEWVRSRAASLGVFDPERLEDAEHRVLRQLDAFARHPLRREIEEAPERDHDLPFSLPSLADEPGDGADDEPGGGRTIELLYRPRGGRWVVVDFCTEYVATPDARAALLADPAFTEPLRSRAQAVRRLMGEEVEARIIFLNDGGAVSHATIPAAWHACPCVAPPPHRNPRH